MTDRPIIFSAPMVLALLAGRKTQTRRLATSPLRRCVPGDRLYVRETGGSNLAATGPRIIYRAEHGAAGSLHQWDLRTGDLTLNVERWTPSIHMLRAWSRLTLIVEDVRVEPLQAISEADAIAEGIAWYSLAGMFGWVDYGDRPGDMARRYFSDPRRSFQSLWQSLHTKPGERWKDNPSVVALTFSVIHSNIDRIEA